MVPLSMTLSDLWPIFQGYKMFGIEHLRNNTTLNYSYYRTSIGSLMHSMEWWHFQWPWRTPNRFSRSRCFWSRISQKRCVLWSKLLKLLIESHTQSIEWYHFQWPWVTFDLDLFYDLDWPLNASRGFLSIMTASCFTFAKYVERRNFLQNVNQMKLGILNTYRKWIVVDWYLVSASTVQQLRNSRSTRYNRWLRSHLVVAQ